MLRTTKHIAAALMTVGALAAGCSSGADRKGDLTRVPTPAPFAPVTEGDLVVEAHEDVKAHLFARGLNLPTGICWDDAGNAYVLESGGFLGNNPGRTPARIVKLDREGNVAETIALKGAHVTYPATAIVWKDGGFFISHRDEELNGCISRVELDGRVKPIVTGLPSRGDHGTNQIAVGPDGKLYFSQGTATNSGVVGLDDFVAFGWPQRFPDVCDVPAKNLILTGRNFLTTDPRGAVPGMKTITGSFKPFGSPCAKGEEVKGNVKSNGSILRVNPDGTGLEVHAWGLRNPFGLGFGPDGQLYATCQGMDLRGSRPIANDLDVLLKVRKDQWYGWPDYTTDLRPLLDSDRNEPPSVLGMPAQPLVDTRASDVHEPDRKDVITKMEHHSSNCGFAFVPATWGTHVGEVVVAQLGTFAPATDPTEVHVPGSKVVILDGHGHVDDLVKNDQPGPASRFGNMGRGFERPVDVKVGPDGALYVVDYGVISIKLDRAAGLMTLVRDGTGMVWRIAPKGLRMPAGPGEVSKTRGS